MAKEASTVEVNTFVAGLNTDSSALTFPDNSSIAEDNFVLNKSGLRNRRLGMDYEVGHSIITTNQNFSAENTYGHSSFRWENAGNDPNQILLLVQFGNEVKFFNLNNTIISSEVIHTFVFDTSTSENTYSYAVVDGILSVVTGQKEITSFEYDIDANTISSTTDILLIRDLFGVAVSIDGSDLTSGNNVSTRPTSINDEHKYNLRNQSWADPRIDANNENLADPISTFFIATGNTRYPANSDSVNKAFYPDANDTDARTKERFFAADLVANRFGNTQSARGHYIIDALERGLSRKEAYDKTIDESPVSLLTISSLLVDRTEGGPSIIAQYAGRNFYTGFNGSLTGGDNKSPRMSSYVLFSKRVEDVGDVVRCYQDGDPTSIDEPDLLDTDGGFIRLDGAYGIKGMINLGSALFVIASNGVWAIIGDDSGSFSATSFSVDKITDRGASGSGTIVEVEGSFTFWSKDGIYSIAKNEFGDWKSTNITDNRISILYSEIESVDRANAIGNYDAFDKKVRWIYRTSISGSFAVRELVLDLTLEAFYTNTLDVPEGGILPKVVGIFQSNPFSISLNPEQVVVGLDNVQANAVDVVVNESTTVSSLRQIQYVTITNVDTVIKYTFSLYRNTNWFDWVTFDGTGVDAAAFMITGYLSGGDFQRRKMLPYMTIYMVKTEDGYEIDGNGDFVATNSSSCLVQTQWQWTDSASGNRFGRQFQAYRHQRLFIPDDVFNNFEDGHTVVRTRNKIRGQGNVISMRFDTEPGKDLQLLGWSLIILINTEV